MKLKLKILLKKDKKNNSSQSKLTHETRDLSHEMKIMSLNSNQNKSRSLILNQLNIEG
jgi:hypothetical protein